VARPGRVARHAYSGTDAEPGAASPTLQVPAGHGSSPGVTIAPTRVSAAGFRRPRLSTRRARETVAFYAFAMPWLLGFVALSAVPLGMGLFLSLTNFDGLNLDSLKFVGLGNYARVLRDPDAIYALGRTAIFMAVVVPLGLLIQLGLAFILNEPVRGRSLFRTLFFLPYVIPPVAAAWVWKAMTASDGGIVNSLVGLVSPDASVNWLVDQPTGVLVSFSVWAGAGAGMVIFLAGLQGIPAELREAALIDGATRWQAFRKVTLPLLTPVIFFQVVLSLITALQVLVQPILLAPGLTDLSAVPPRDNYFFAVHAYNQIFLQQRFGYGVALLWILFAIVLVMTVVLFRTSRRWVVYYEVEQ
jgi:multiple sugar transport system permease protein